MVWNKIFGVLRRCNRNVLYSNYNYRQLKSDSVDNRDVSKPSQMMSAMMDFCNTQPGRSMQHRRNAVTCSELETDIRNLENIVLYKILLSYDLI